MTEYIQITHTVLLWVVFGLAIIALVAELLPEVEAKLIVVPTLILVIGLILTERKIRIKQ
jgi:hypothetical protein